jgi:putative addiction module component (TIGR02574 family)
MPADYHRAMVTIAEIEKLAQNLSENDRALLAAHLLESLPPVLHDEDEGIAEALRRDAELEGNPSAGLSLEQLDQQIERRRT